MPAWLHEIAPLGILLAVVALVIARLPRIDLGHSDAFRRRRILNWLPLGLTYAFLYWGRYNLNPAIQAIGGKEMVADFNWVFGAGTAVYGVSFILNGPLTDRFGGKLSMLLGAAGACVANLAMGVVSRQTIDGAMTKDALFWWLVFLYPANMYFQSFGAVAIVKVNAPWFHVRERGVFGAVFGILISLGIYFAFDWSKFIVDRWPAHWAFTVPAVALAAGFVAALLSVRNEPGQAGHANFDTGDASSGDTGPSLGAVAVFRAMFSNPIIVTIACVEFCSGFLRQAIMQMYRPFAKATGGSESFVYANWGLLLCCAGILGGVVAGVISDHLFQSRRGPVAAVLYCGMLLGAVLMSLLLATPSLAWLVIFMSLCIIGVHGMLSGTASMDFGGARNVGVAVGIIDGFVYAGTAAQAILYANVLPKGGDAAAVVGNWTAWPVSMIPVAAIGLVLAARVWNAKPQAKGASAH